MIVVIVAGGAGTRLWPLSTATYPKHLLTLNGDSRTLLQRTYERAKLITGGPQNIYVVSEAGHISHVQEQLPELAEDHFVIEPARRGTASCLAAAMVRIKAADSFQPDEVLAFIPADHHIRDTAGFVQTFKLAEHAASKHRAITLVGVEPDYPATGFGYIEKRALAADESFVYQVGSFREKPDYRTAQQYLNSGQYLWNCSYHVGMLETFEAVLERSAPTVFANYQRLAAATADEYEAAYLSFENISIEYALTEKMSDLLVVAGTFDWLDLGSFADMHKAVGSDESGNFTHGLVETDEVANSFIQNNEDKPVAVIGLDNVVVINSPNGVLVMRKDRSQRVGDVSARFRKKK